MLKSDLITAPSLDQVRLDEPADRADGLIFAATKRGVDIVSALIGLTLLIPVIPFVCLVNIWLNPGPIFFRQTRMGRDCRPFVLVKFRSMVPAGTQTRTFDAPLEVDRITVFGAWLRRSRLDELPQVINILRGEMSLIGPRPDTWDHATAFCRMIPDYSKRHAVRPGITGLAQVAVGYAQDLETTRLKVHNDLDYIARKDIGLDLTIMLRTAQTILGDTFRRREI